MPTAVQIRLLGGPKLKREFSAIGAAIRGRLLANAVLAGALVVEGEAKRRVARRTSTLARSISSIVTERSATGAKATVGTNVEYGPFLEFGTGIHGPERRPIIIRPRRRSALRFQIGGRIIFAKQVESPGIKPKPFLLPALEAKAEAASRKVSDVVWSQVRRIAA